MPQVSCDQAAPGFPARPGCCTQRFPVDFQACRGRSGSVRARFGPLTSVCPSGFARAFRSCQARFQARFRGLLEPRSLARGLWTKRQGCSPRRRLPFAEHAKPERQPSIDPGFGSSAPPSDSARIPSLNPEYASGRRSSPAFRVAGLPSRPGERDERSPHDSRFVRAQLGSQVRRLTAARAPPRNRPPHSVRGPDESLRC